ncbi:hypothetical protein DESUT3_03170 [Desulfuromonas versatilis]|uniref:Uncharacterized protein n=1 Tax=Desulfuromonas versatilis TaxID=2802975 RepID=A0ABN6DSU0_9BACT|nr:hypothetical protein [Desulfuromonas versatilis]BCR03248.1 hypothetical protein DESUT3_03170 [Desulfuromonas versatilis]
MQLSESEVRQICLTPLVLIYAVASAARSPEKINQLHIIRAVEHGLLSEDPFCAELFDFFRNNLHHFFREFATRCDPADLEALLAEVRATAALLQQMASGAAFREAFVDFARQLGEGSLLGKALAGAPVLQERAGQVVGILQTGQ